MHYGNPIFYIIEFHTPKAFFCSNINAHLQIFFELQGCILQATNKQENCYQARVRHHKHNK